MASFADLNEIVNRMSGGNSGTPQVLDMHKEHRVAGAAAAAPIAGGPISLWEFEGQPSHGAVPPTSVAYPDNTTQGGWKQNDPSGGRELWAPVIGASCLAQGRVVIYDRLAHISGLSGTVTTAQNVLASAITRYTSGEGNWIAYEVYTQIGATGTTITADYTNQAGTASRTSQAISIGNTGFREAQRLRRFSLAAGDTGARAVNTVTLAATTGTAGNFGIIVGHTLASLIITLPQGQDLRTIMDGSLAQIQTDACLAWYFVPTTTTTPGYDMFATLVER